MADKPTPPKGEDGTAAPTVADVQSGDGVGSAAAVAELNASAPVERRDDEDVERHTESLVVMRIGDRWLAVQANTVREVVIKGFVTRLPLAPPHLLGLTLVHGRLVPVVSLAELIEGVAAGESGQMLPRLVVVTRGEQEVAIVTDEARGVVELDVALGASIGTLSGVSVLAEVPWEGRMLAIVDAGSLVATSLSR